MAELFYNCLLLAFWTLTEREEDGKTIHFTHANHG